MPVAYNGHLSKHGTAPSYPLPVAGVGVWVEPQQGLLVHDCSDRLAGHSWVSFPPKHVYSSLLLSGRFLSSGTRAQKHVELLSQLKAFVLFRVTATLGCESSHMYPGLKSGWKKLNPEAQTIKMHPMLYHICTASLFEAHDKESNRSISGNKGLTLF